MRGDGGRERQAGSGRRPRRVARGLLVAGLTLVVLDPCAGLLARRLLPLTEPLPPFGLHPTGRQEEWMRDVRAVGDGSREGVWAFDAELGWTQRPDGEGFRGEIHTNSIGARGVREYAERPPEGVLRVVCCGDSFTLGSDVDDEDAYPARVEARDAAVEAINLGVGGYGTDQALLRFRREGARLHPDVVAIGILLENIGRNVNRWRPLWVPSSTSAATKPRFVLGPEGGLELVPQPFATQDALLAAVADGSVRERVRAHEYWYARPDLGLLRWSSIARLLGSIDARRARSIHRLWLDRDGEPFRVTVAILQAFHDEALAAGARDAVVLVFPTRDALATRAAGEPLWWQGLLDALAARDVPVLDLSDPLHGELEVQRATGDLERLYTPGGHLTPVANDTVARALLRYLGREGGGPPHGDPRSARGGAR